MEALNIVWNHWLALAWVAPAAWAAAAIVDVFIIDRGVYRDPLQATAISGTIVALPFLLLALPMMEPAGLDVTTFAMALAGGICDILMLLFYYKAMFTTNDVAHAETFFNLEVLFIPLLAFAFVGEHLGALNYVGVGLAALGVVILNGSAGRYFSRHARLTAFLLAAVLASSAGIVIQDLVFARTGYWNGLVGYAFGILLGVIPLVRYSGLRDSFAAFRRNRGVILGAEAFTLVASFAGLRAIDLSPSASLVAVIESTRPLLIMLACLFAWLMLNRIRRCPADAIEALRAQFEAAPGKLAANGLIIGGVYVVSLSALQS